MSYCVVRCWCCTTPCTTLYDASYAPDASGPDALYDAPTRRTMHFRQCSGVTPHPSRGPTLCPATVSLIATALGALVAVGADIQSSVETWPLSPPAVLCLQVPLVAGLGPALHSPSAHPGTTDKATETEAVPMEVAEEAEVLHPLRCGADGCFGV